MLSNYNFQPLIDATIAAEARKITNASFQNTLGSPDASAGSVPRDTIPKVCEWFLAVIVDRLGTDEGVRASLTAVFRDQHADLEPMAYDLADTALVVFRSWLSEISITDGNDPESPRVTQIVK